MLSYTARGKKCYHDIRDRRVSAVDFRQIRVAHTDGTDVKEINASHALRKVHARMLRTRPFQFLQFLSCFGHQIRCGEYLNKLLKVPDREVRLI